DAEALPDLELGQGLALVIEDEESDLHGDRDGDGRALLAGTLLLDGAQHMQRRGFRRADMAGAVTVAADLGAGLEQARPQALARELQQAEGADAATLDAGAIVAHRFLQP